LKLTRSRLWKLIVLAACALLLSPYPSSKAMTHAEAAKQIGQQLGLPMSSDSETLYGLFPDPFPGGYEGTVDLAYPDHEMTWEHALVVLVKWAGWDTVNYSRQLVPAVQPYVTPEGFPYYKFTPTPRSIPYIVAALSAGLITVDELPKLRTNISTDELHALTDHIKSIREKGMASRQEPPKGIPHLLFPTNDARFAVAEPGFNDYDKIGRIPLPGALLDLNAPGIRLFNMGSPFQSGKQDYFPLGPLHAMFSAGMTVDAKDYSHQAEAIYGTTENASRTVNAIGIWGAATSHAYDARVWGAFLTAQTASGDTNDAQVIGAEIDVLNHAKPGVSPNASKVGLQLVTIGSADSTNAVEVIADGVSRWHTGISYDDHSIAKDGTLLSMSQHEPVRTGLDLALGQFTDAALHIGNEQVIRFDPNKVGQSATIGNDKNNFLVIVSGKEGFAVKDNSGEKTLLTIRNDGRVVFENAKPVLKSPSGQLYAISVSDSGELKTEKVSP